jgi:LPXTG-motif cell wall-anchored protein
MARRRKHYRRNPSQTTWLLIGGAVVLAGVGYYFYSKKATTPATGPTPIAPAPNAAALPGGTSQQIPAGLQMILNDPTSSQACKDKVMSQVPIFQQYNDLLAICLPNPAGPGCSDKFPAMQAQIEAIQNDFNKVCS